MAFKTIQLGTLGQVDALSSCAGTTGLTKYIEILPIEYQYLLTLTNLTWK